MCNGMKLETGQATTTVCFRTEQHELRRRRMFAVPASSTSPKPKLASPVAAGVRALTTMSPSRGACAMRPVQLPRLLWFRLGPWLLDIASRIPISCSWSVPSAQAPQAPLSTEERRCLIVSFEIILGWLPTRGRFWTTSSVVLSQDERLDRPLVIVSNKSSRDARRDTRREPSVAWFEQLVAPLSRCSPALKLSTLMSLDPRRDD